MLEADSLYIKLIDFGEAKIVDNFVYEKNHRDSTSESSEESKSIFSRMMKGGGRQAKKGTFVGTPFY